MSSGKTAEELKELGNKAFAAQKFDEAIELYSQAIKLDPNNHVFFSNRSASYAGLKKWKEAMDDAKECIRLNPEFMKGYYRLATAQIEVEEYDAAQATIKQGLSLDANNSQLLKVMKNIKQLSKKKRAAIPNTAAASASNGIVDYSHLSSKLDAATSRELYDLQVQYAQTQKEFSMVQANLNKTTREEKVQQLTHDELVAQDKAENSNSTQSKGGAYYRSIGKIFFKSNKERVLEHLQTSIEEHGKKKVDMTSKLEYLERRMKSQQQNMQELTKDVSKS